MQNEKMAISRKQVASEVPMVTNIITDDCIYTGLFGSLDSARMGIVSQKIIELCEDKEVSIAIIDLCNVHAIDTAVAGHINKLGMMLNFVGIEPILCGISSELANTMAQAGVELNKMIIVRNLKEALKESFKLSGVELVKK